MDDNSQALFVIGSPRGAKGVSHQLGNHLAGRLKASGLSTDIALAYKAMRQPATADGLAEEMLKERTTVVITPLYIDCLPTPVLRLLETVHQKCSTGTRPGGRLMAIVNSGFPEGEQNKTALRILEQFARETGFEWAGGLAIGAGPMVEGRSLEEAGAMARPMIAALDLVADAIAGGISIPEKAAKLVRRPVAPSWMYITLANVGWWLQARKNGVAWQINARPYTRSRES